MEGSTPDEHVSVDQILCSFASLLMSCHGEVRLSCRLGGEQTEGVTPEAQGNGPSRAASAEKCVVECRSGHVCCMFHDKGRLVSCSRRSLSPSGHAFWAQSRGCVEPHRAATKAMERWTFRLLVKLVFRPSFSSA